MGGARGAKVAGVPKLIADLRAAYPSAQSKTVAKWWEDLVAAHMKAGREAQRIK